MCDHHLRHPTDQDSPRSAPPRSARSTILAPWRWFIYLAHSSCFWRCAALRATKGLEKGHLTTRNKKTRAKASEGIICRAAPSFRVESERALFPIPLLVWIWWPSRKKCHHNLLLFAWFASGLHFIRVCTYCSAAVKERPRRIQSCVVLRWRQLMVSFNDDLNPESQW